MTSMAEPVSLKSQRPFSSFCAWSTAFCTSCMGGLETMSIDGMGPPLRRSSAAAHAAPDVTAQLRAGDVDAVDGAVGAVERVVEGGAAAARSEERRVGK